MYKHFLLKPIKIGFGIEQSHYPFLDLINSFFLQRPPRSSFEPQWCLEKVLKLLQSDCFCNNPSFEDLMLKKVFE